MEGLRAVEVMINSSSRDLAISLGLHEEQACLDVVLDLLEMAGNLQVIF